MDKLASIALAIGLVGGVHDLLTRRIPNWLTIPGLLLGVVLQVWFYGLFGAMDAFLAVALSFILFFPIYFLGYMGAGDVKLMMATSSFLGWHNGLRVLVLSVVVGGVFSLFDTLLRGRLILVLKNTYSFLRSLLLPALVAEPLKLDEKRKFAFGICIPIALMLGLFLKNRGVLSWL